MNNKGLQSDNTVTLFTTSLDMIQIFQEPNKKCGNCDALQREGARRRASRSPPNYDAHTDIQVDQPISCCLIAFSLLVPYVTL